MINSELNSNEIKHEAATPIAFIKLYLSDVLSKDEQDELKPYFIQLERLFGIDKNNLDTDSNLKAIIDSVIKKYGAVNPSLNISAIHDEDENINYDSFKINRILYNLINNSITHASGSDIIIKISNNKSMIRINYQDNGPGIPLAIQKKLFTQGIKNDNSPGSGLGLSIIKKIIDESNGTIRLIPSRNGTSFEISLPLLNN